MKSNEVYSQLKLILAPWFKEHGFKRAKCQLGWYKPSGDRFIVVWFHLFSHGFGLYEGGSFTMEFQGSSEPVIYSFQGYRSRFARLLSEHDREQVRDLQNRVIANLTYPPKSYYEHLPPELIETFLKGFKQIEKPYHIENDIWLRYSKPEHIELWANFILQKLPECINKITEIDKSTIQKVSLL